VDMSLTLELIFFQTSVVTGETPPFVWPSMLVTGTTFSPLPHHFYLPTESSEAVHSITTQSPLASQPMDKMHFIRALKNRKFR